MRFLPVLLLVAFAGCSSELPSVEPPEGGKNDQTAVIAKRKITELNAQAATIRSLATRLLEPVDMVRSDHNFGDSAVLERLITLQRASMIIVPTDTPGFELVRNVSVMGHAGNGHASHGEVSYQSCRVPRSNLLGSEGGGFVIAQERLGPGRIFHCMRWLGQAQRAYELLCNLKRVPVDTLDAAGPTIVVHGRGRDGLAREIAARGHLRRLVVFDG